jgi:fused signal recognition particle receptor
MAEQAPPPRRPAAPAPEELKIPPVPADATPPADIIPEPAPEPVAVVPPAPEPVVVAPVAVEPPLAAAAPPPVAPEPAPEPIPAPATEPESAAPAVGPAIKPIVLGADPVPVAAPKRGWWKR